MLMSPFVAGVSRPGAYYLPRVHAVRTDQDQARGRDHAGGSCTRPYSRPATGTQGRNLIYTPNAIVADPDPNPDPDSPDPHVNGPPESGSISQRYGSGSFYHHAKIIRKILNPTIL
jgi:hypothetical protein